MAYVFTAQQYANKLLNVLTYPTHYRGTNGSTLPKYNIGAWDGTNFCFDCSGLVKSVLWGWSGNKSAAYGGATYCANGVPDINDDASWGFGQYATNTDVLNAPMGALLWKQGHVGVSIGGGYAVECTPAFNGGVQKTAISGRGWSKWGYLPWINYATISNKYKVGDTVNYTGIYTNSSSSNKLTPKYKTGTIIQLVDGANNPYLVQYNGITVGWTNDACITGKAEEEPTTTNIADKFIEGLALYGDGRYSYYNSYTGTGIGCSDYFCLGLKYIGYLKDGETTPWAGQSRLGILTDTTRFQKLAWDPSILKKGDILWSHGHHVAIWDGVKGVYEAAPESSHGICDNGKTGVGHWSTHGYYNCGTGTYTWTNIYRLVDNTKTTTTNTTTTTSTTTSPTTDTTTVTSIVKLTAKEKLAEATKIWNGEYGSNPGRKEKLVALYGEDQAAVIQKLVDISYKDKLD